MNESLDFNVASDVTQGSGRRALMHLAQGFALAGGLTFMALIGMSLVSIVGRKLFSAPIRGDMELMEVGASFAIAAFLPLCELRGQHIKVDALTQWLPVRVRDLLDVLAHLLCCAMAWIMAWRTTQQMFDNHENGDVTTLLSFPLWIPLMLIVPSLVLLGVCALARISDIFQRMGGRA